MSCWSNQSRRKRIARGDAASERDSIVGWSTKFLPCNPHAKAESGRTMSIGKEG